MGIPVTPHPREDAASRLERSGGRLFPPPSISTFARMCCSCVLVLGIGSQHYGTKISFARAVAVTAARGAAEDAAGVGDEDSAHVESAAGDHDGDVRVQEQCSAEDGDDKDWLMVDDDDDETRERPASVGGPVETPSQEQDEIEGENKQSLLSSGNSPTSTDGEEQEPSQSSEVICEGGKLLRCKNQEPIEEKVVEEKTVERVGMDVDEITLEDVERKAKATRTHDGEEENNEEQSRENTLAQDDLDDGDDDDLFGMGQLREDEHKGADASTSGSALLQEAQEMETEDQLFEDKKSTASSDFERFFIGDSHEMETSDEELRALLRPSLSETLFRQHVSETSRAEQLADGQEEQHDGSNDFLIRGPFPLTNVGETDFSGHLSRALVTQNLDRANLRIAPEAEEVLSQLQGPFYIAAVHGTMRTGKSTMLSLLARLLNRELAVRVGWSTSSRGDYEASSSPRVLLEKILGNLELVEDNNPVEDARRAEIIRAKEEIVVENGEKPIVIPAKYELMLSEHPELRARLAGLLREVEGHEDSTSTYAPLLAEAFIDYFAATHRHAHYAGTTSAADTNAAFLGQRRPPLDRATRHDSKMLNFVFEFAPSFRFSTASGTVYTHTLGQMFCTFPYKDGTFILLDSEGADNTRRGEEFDSQLFTVAYGLSSVVMLRPETALNRRNTVNWLVLSLNLAQLALQKEKEEFEESCDCSGTNSCAGAAGGVLAKTQLFQQQQQRPLLSSQQSSATGRFAPPYRGGQGEDSAIAKSSVQRHHSSVLGGDRVEQTMMRTDAKSLFILLKDIESSDPTRGDRSEKIRSEILREAAGQFVSSPSAPRAPSPKSNNPGAQFLLSMNPDHLFLFANPFQSARMSRDAVKAVKEDLLSLRLANYNEEYLETLHARLLPALLENVRPLQFMAGGGNISGNGGRGKGNGEQKNGEQDKNVIRSGEDLLFFLQSLVQDANKKDAFPRMHAGAEAIQVAQSAAFLRKKSTEFRAFLQESYKNLPFTDDSLYLAYKQYREEALEQYQKSVSKFNPDMFLEDEKRLVDEILDHDFRQLREQNKLEGANFARRELLEVLKGLEKRALEDEEFCARKRQNREVSPGYSHFEEVPVVCGDAANEGAEDQDGSKRTSEEMKDYIGANVSYKETGSKKLNDICKDAFSETTKKLNERVGKDAISVAIAEVQQKVKDLKNQVKDRNKAICESLGQQAALRWAVKENKISEEKFKDDLREQKQNLKKAEETFQLQREVQKLQMDELTRETQSKLEKAEMENAEKVAALKTAVEEAKENSKKEEKRLEEVHSQAMKNMREEIATLQNRQKEVVYVTRRETKSGCEVM